MSSFSHSFVRALMSRMFCSFHFTSFHSATHPPTPSISSMSFIHPFNNPSTRPSIHTSIRPFISHHSSEHSCIDSFIRSFIHATIRSLPLIHSSSHPLQVCMHTLIHSCSHPFTHASIHSLTHLVMPFN